MKILKLKLWKISDEFRSLKFYIQNILVAYNAFVDMSAPSEDLILITIRGLPKPPLYTFCSEESIERLFNNGWTSKPFIQIKLPKESSLRITDL